MCQMKELYLLSTKSLLDGTVTNELPEIVLSTVQWLNSADLSSEEAIEDHKLCKKTKHSQHYS